MRSIAIVTMLFLPGAYIAVGIPVLVLNSIFLTLQTLFSMNMFDWQAQGDEKVLSGNFWVYWAVTLPVTAIVLAVWAVWSKPWKAEE